MEKINTINFKGIHYAKSAIFANEIHNGVKPYLINNFPKKTLKDVVESSSIFNDLKDKTDVYISSYTDWNQDPAKGYLRAIFKDPYRQFNHQPDTINLEATGESEETIFEKLKRIANELPIYKILRGDNLFGIVPLSNNTDGFITIG